MGVIEEAAVLQETRVAQTTDPIYGLFCVSLLHNSQSLILKKTSDMKKKTQRDGGQKERFEAWRTEKASEALAVVIKAITSLVINAIRDLGRLSFTGVSMKCRPSDIRVY